MNQVNYEFIERYQKLYEKDPKSKVFAPLGEAYRKIGLLKEALQVLKRGVRFHPHFASGRVALAKVYMDNKEFEAAITELYAATELSPDNLLAQKLIAECYVLTKQTKEALKSYKMVLFLNPNDAHALAHIKKLESLTADEYEDEIFEMQPLRADIAPFRNAKNDSTNEPSHVLESPHLNVSKERQLERILSLSDAFIARLDLERAYETLKEGEILIGAHPEIQRRKHFISSRLDESILGDNTAESSLTFHSPMQETQNSKATVDLLNDLLQKIEKRKR